ncbi:hypothetical protein Tco_0965851 [Tanacetum coccineum]
MIGSLMYLTTSRPDITFAVCTCARFQVTPKTSHLHAVKRIFRYLKGQPKLGVWYPRDSPFDLEAFSDNDYAGASLDKKSTIGGFQFLGKRLISWQCKKQTIVANSTTEAKYVAAANCYGQHIEIRHHFIRDSYEKKLIHVIKIHTDQNVVDPLTKAFDVTKRGRDTKIPQSGGPLTKVGNEAVHKELGDKMERAATTIYSLEAEQYSGSGPRYQDTILGDADAQTWFETASIKFNDPPLSRVNTLRSGRTAIAKVKTVNGERQLQALIDKKKMIITETSIRSDLHLEDAGGTDCLPTATIFKELARMGRKQRKEAEVPQDDTQHEENIPTPSNDPQPSSEDRMQLTELMILCTNLQKQVLDLEKAKDTQAKEIDGLKKRVQKLEKRKKLRITGFKRLRKVGSARSIKSSEDKDSLGDQEDLSKQGRKIKDLDADTKVTLINETQERQDEDLMFDAGVLDGDEVIVDVAAGEKEEQSTKVDEMEVSTAEVVTTASEADTTAGVEVSVAPTISVTTAASTPQISKDELSLAQTLIEIKAAKFKVVTTAAVTRPKAKGIVFHDQEEQVSVSKPIVPPVQPTIKDKRKAIMQEPEKPMKFKGKDQIEADEELAKRLNAEIQAELLEEKRLARKKDEETNIALIKS